MAGISRRDRFELPEPMRRFFEGDWDVSSFRVEEYRDGATMVVRAELPSIDPEKDLDVTVSEGMLRIRGERRETEEHKSRDGYRTEFKYGSFTRDIPLPAGATQDDVSASYRDGVLEVRVPLQESGSSGRKVPVNRV
ncbi:Hsp20/alpha crystallin family protein [Arthrobacter sp.]|uniref:Hsp20/alpha crystallin family protein n=1 Tax=Arthrobacter sp. TaxID=1667 RepID=UPI00289B560B|nr:Hsp20/alpha crystallin family protein [Arthrobacter sp.]